MIGSECRSGTTRGKLVFVTVSCSVVCSSETLVLLHLVFCSGEVLKQIRIYFCCSSDTFGVLTVCGRKDYTHW